MDALSSGGWMGGWLDALSRGDWMDTLNRGG